MDSWSSWSYWIFYCFIHVLRLCLIFCRKSSLFFVIVFRNHNKKKRCSLLLRSPFSISAWRRLKDLCSLVEDYVGPRPKTVHYLFNGMPMMALPNKVVVFYNNQPKQSDMDKLHADLKTTAAQLWNEKPISLQDQESWKEEQTDVMTRPSLTSNKMNFDLIVLPQRDQDIYGVGCKELLEKFGVDYPPKLLHFVRCTDVVINVKENKFYFRPVKSKKNFMEFMSWCRFGSV